MTNGSYVESLTCLYMNIVYTSLVCNLHKAVTTITVLSYLTPIKRQRTASHSKWNRPGVHCKLDTNKAKQIRRYKPQTKTHRYSAIRKADIYGARPSRKSWHQKTILLGLEAWREVYGDTDSGMMGLAWQAPSRLVSINMWDGEYRISQMASWPTWLPFIEANVWGQDRELYAEIL